jgi:hypothetical protein
MRAELNLQIIHVKLILLCLMDAYACRAHLTKNLHKIYIIVFIGSLCVRRAQLTKNSNKVYIIVFIGCLCVQSSA